VGIGLSVFLLVALLAGCSAGSSAILDTALYASGSGKNNNSLEGSLDPRFAYLRVTVEGRPLFLARGDIDEIPQGQVEVWYSSSREVIRLLNGRLVGAVGTTIEWRGVAVPKLPSWHELAQQKHYEWVRMRDVMPGYRFGVSDHLVLKVVPPPDKSALQSADPLVLTWFEESAKEPNSKSQLVQGFEPLPTARYAVSFAGGKEQVVYGEQCLALAFCFTWQRWGQEPVAANKK